MAGALKLDVQFSKNLTYTMSFLNKYSKSVIHYASVEKPVQTGNGDDRSQQVSLSLSLIMKS